MSGGRENAEVVEQRRINAQHELLKNAFGADLRDDTAISFGASLPESDVPAVTEAFENGKHIPAALRELAGWKRWAGEHRAHNFLALTAAARQSGMDRFSSSAIAGLVFDRVHDMGAGGGKLTSVDIIARPDQGNLELVLRYDQYGDVRNTKSSKPK